MKRRPFLRTVQPFDVLSEDDLKRVSAGLEEVSFPAGTLILDQGRTSIDALHVIRSGAVRLFLKDLEDHEVLDDYRGPGDFFGALGIIMESKANLCVEAVQDTSCLLVSREDFWTLMETYPAFSLFYLKSFCKRYIHSAHFTLKKKKKRIAEDGGLYLFSQSIGGVTKQALKTCLPTDSVQQAAQKMVQNRIGSLLVKDAKGAVEGIITDKDLRSKLIARGRDCNEPVRSIMSSPVKTAPSEALCFDALFSMLKNRIHHLGVERDGNIVGMITAHDLMMLQGDSPIFLFQEIAAQVSIEGLYEIYRKIPPVVKRLIDEGAKASNINRVITVLNDHILERILTLLIKDMGPPPVPFCWMVMGSEGRKEQTFKTDQDNALVYEDIQGNEPQERAREYFLKFAEQCVNHLAACGYPLCPGNIMASNPAWNQPLSAWKECFDRWIFSPDPMEILHSTIFFDFRPAFGKSDLAHSLREHLLGRTVREKVFIHHLARDCLNKKPPLSMFKNFAVEKSGPNKGSVDLKTKGLTPFVDFARLMCLDQGLAETNTLERIQALCAQKALSEGFALRIRQAYEYQMQLRLVNQLDMIEKGKAPENHVDPSGLTELEKISLKKAFLAIEEIRSFMSNFFHLNLG